MTKSAKETRWTAEPWKLLMTPNSTPEHPEFLIPGVGLVSGHGNAARAISCVNALRGVEHPEALGDLVKAAQIMLEFDQSANDCSSDLTGEWQSTELMSAFDGLRSALSKLGVRK